VGVERLLSPQGKEGTVSLGISITKHEERGRSILLGNFRLNPQFPGGGGEGKVHGKETLILC